MKFLCTFNVNFNVKIKVFEMPGYGKNKNIF